MDRILIINLIIQISYIYGWCIYSDFLFYLLKPLPILILIYNFNNPKYIFNAFIFALLGDIFLMFDSLISLIFGIISFSITHIYLSKLFLSYCSDISKHMIELLSSIPLTFLILYNYIYDNVPIYLFVPIFFYGCLLINTCMLTVFINKLTFNKHIMIFIGMLSFVISDFLLVINMFAFNIKYSCIYVMITYWLSMTLIFLSTN